MRKKKTPPHFDFDRRLKYQGNDLMVLFLICKLNVCVALPKLTQNFELSNQIKIQTTYRLAMQFMVESMKFALNIVDKNEQLCTHET